MGRFILHDQLPVGAYRNSCAITGSYAPEEKFLDIDFAVDNDTPNGDLFVREAVVREWAELISYVSPEKYAELAEQYAAQRTLIQELTERCEAAEGTVAALRYLDKRVPISK